MTDGPVQLRKGDSNNAGSFSTDYVMTQANCESKISADDGIGLVSYPMDSHFCQRVVVEKDGNKVVRNEGGFGHRCPKPYPVSYR